MSGTNIQKGLGANFVLKDADYEKSSPIEKTHQRGKQTDDPRFGQITIYSNPTNKTLIAMKERKVTDKAEAGKLIAAARQRIAMNHPNLINLLDYSVTKQSELCSSFYILRYFYEFPKNDLRKQFTERQKQGVAFNSNELTNILYQQINAQSYLQSQGLAHGDVQPLLIGYDPLAKDSKLIDKNDLVTNEQAVIALQKNHLVSQSSGSIYQSPTVYQNLKKGNQKFTFDKNKEDAYALGLVLLEAGNGRKIDNIYDKNGTVDQNALNQHINEFRGKFESGNQLLTSTVANLVNPNESQRPSPVEVKSNLPPYEEVQKFFNQNQQQGQEQNWQNNNLSGKSTNTYTRTEIDGGAQNIIIKDKIEMPDINYDLFSFNPQNNPYTVQSKPPAFEEEIKSEPEQFIVPQPKYLFKYHEQSVNTSDNKNNQIIYNEPIVETQELNLFSKPKVNANSANNNVQESYTQPPIQTTERSFNQSQPQVTYSQSNVVYNQPKVNTYYDNSYSTGSYIPQSVDHEFRLHDSSIVKPEVITNDSYTSYGSTPQTSQIVHTTAPTYYSRRSNAVFAEAPITTVHTITEPIVQKVSYSQVPQTVYTDSGRRSFTTTTLAPTTTVYTEAPRTSFRTYTQAPVQTVYTETPVQKDYVYTGRRSYTTSNLAPTTTTTTVYSQAPVQTVYTESPIQTVYTDTGRRSFTTNTLAPTTTVYTEAPRTSFRTYSQAPVQTIYAEAPVQTVYTENYVSSPVTTTYVQGSSYIGGSQTHVNSIGFDTSGLKLVKSYQDNRLATNVKNY